MGKENLQLCDFSNCKKNHAGYCSCLELYNQCSHIFYKNSHEKIIKDWKLISNYMPSVLGYYSVFVYDKKMMDFKYIYTKWDGNKFVDLDEKIYNFVGWR